jgi:hypothetical protein
MRPSNLGAQTAIQIGLSQGILEDQFMENAKFSVSNCKSGYSVEATSASTVSLYSGDYGCLVKLVEFSLNGEAFQASENDPFTTWLPGDQALFQSSVSPNKVMPVKVFKQVSSPALKDDYVQYRFGDLEKATSGAVSTGTVALNQPIITLDLAPQFKLKSGQIHGFDRDGRGLFQFELVCLSRLQGKALGALCDKLPLSQISYVLTEDLWNGRPTVYEMMQLFGSGGIKITSGEVVAPSRKANGGFRTKAAKDKEVLKSPGSLAGKSRLLLVLRGGSGGFKAIKVVNQGGR